MISDAQIDRNIPEAGEILRQCAQHMDADAVLMCGDLSEHGLREELEAFYAAFAHNCPAVQIETIPGNMDGVHTPAGAKAFRIGYEKGCGERRETVYCSRVHPECAVFGLSEEKDDDDAPIGEAQLRALDELLRTAAEREIPALVFGHYVLDGTIAVDWPFAFWGPQSEEIKALFGKYGGKVVYFSGHIHRGLTAMPGVSAVQRDGVAYVSVPSLCAPDNEHYQSDIEAPGTGWMVEIEDGRIALCGYDFISGKRIEGFSFGC